MSSDPHKHSLALPDQANQVQVIPSQSVQASQHQVTMEEAVMHEWLPNFSIYL